MPFKSLIIIEVHLSGAGGFWFSFGHRLTNGLTTGFINILNFGR